ncbi:hypothetical protein ACEE08_04065 [Staphylococcus rostri]|nr:hypothetical protein [Staphylococcus rostri]
MSQRADHGQAVATNDNDIEAIVINSDSISIIHANFLHPHMQEVFLCYKQ